MLGGRVWRILLILLLVCKRVSLVRNTELSFVFDKRYIHYRIVLTLSGCGGVESLRVFGCLR